MKKGARKSKGGGAAAKKAAPQLPERKRGKSTGAITRLVAQVQKTTMIKAKSDEAAIKLVEESIQHRFMEGAEYFDKENLVAELITEHKGNFKRIDLQLTAQHTVATRKLHHLVFQHSNGFLNLFREVHKAHDLVDALKKEVHSMKTIIAALSKVTFASAGSGRDGASRGQLAQLDELQQAAGRHYRPSMMVDSGLVDRLLEVPSSPTQSLHCASYHLAAHVIRPPSATILSKDVDEAANILKLRDVAIEEARQLIGELELTTAADCIRTLNDTAEASGLEPVVLQLEQELAIAVTKQLARLPVTIAYFDALHLPLLELLVELRRPQQATEWFLTLHSRCIASELRHVQGTTDGNELCLVATDLVVTMIKMTLRGLGRLGLPNDPKRPDVPFVNAQVILWVRREIESFGSGFLALQILTTYRSNAAKSVDQLSVVTATLSECVSCVRRMEEFGFPHADVYFMHSMREPLTQLLNEIGRRTYKKQSSISQSMWNAVRIAVREDAKRFLNSGTDDKLIDDSVTREALAEIAALNKLNMVQFGSLAPSSHLSLLQLMCFPSASHVFQASSSHRIDSDALHETLKRGLQLDPYVWSKSTVVRKLLADGASAKQLAVIAARLSTSPTGAVPRPMRLTLVEALASYRFSGTGINAALEKDAAERLQFLTANSGGAANSVVVTPAVLSELLTRPDIATPYWSRAIRDVFGDGLESTIHQVLPAVKDVLALLGAHGGTNAVTQTHRKVMLSVLRNYRFVDADIPEECVERMDKQHLDWMFSAQCPLSYWSYTGPREYLADIFDSVPQVRAGAADIVAELRSDRTIEEAHRARIQREIGPLVLSACAIEDALRDRGAHPSLDYVKGLLTPAGVTSGQWPRLMRVVIALALEKKYVGHSGFAEVASVARKLRDPVPIRVGLEDRKLVASMLSSKGDDAHLIAAMSLVGDHSPEELDEEAALASITPHHLTHMIDRKSADIGVAYWSRATRDALADALERIHLQKPSEVAGKLIRLLRSSPLLTTRLSVDERRSIRDQLKRKVTTEPSVSTREIAKQQWARISPAMVQRFILANGSATAGSSSGSGGSDPASGAANYWCDVVRRCVRSVIEAIMDHRRSLVDVLRGTTRVSILKRDRVELSKLLEGYTFTTADIAKRAGPPGSSTNSSVKQLLTKAQVPHDDFSVLMTTTVGPSALLHTTTSVLFALHASARDHTQSRLLGIAGNERHLESLDTPPVPSALLQDPCLAEVLDKTCMGVCLAMMDVVRRVLGNIKTFCSHRMIQEGFQQLSGASPAVVASPAAAEFSTPVTSKSLCRHGLRDAPFVWVFHTVFAVYLDALALGIAVAFATAPHSIEQRVGEASAIRVELLAQMHQNTLAPFLVELAELVMRAAKEGPNCFINASTSPPSFASELITARYNGGSNIPLSDVTAPARMAGCVLPLEGYAAWRVITTIPRYPHFALDTVTLDDEAFLFHFVVQISLNLMSVFQEVLLGDFEDIKRPTSHSNRQQRSTPDKLLRRLRPTDYSITQSWVVQRSSGSNHIAALSVLQYLVVTTLQDICNFAGEGNVVREIYGDDAFTSAAADPQILKQVLIFFAAFYYFWVPLFSSDRASSLFVGGYLSPESALPTAGAKKTEPSSASSVAKKGAEKAGPAAPDVASASTLTSGVSRLNIDQLPAKASLVRVTFPIEQSSSADATGTDPLRLIIDGCFAATPALERYGAALHSDAMKSKLSTLLTKVNLLQFAAKKSFDDEAGSDDDDEQETDDDDDEDEEDLPPQRGAVPAAKAAENGSAQALVTMAHLHELLIHYVRLVS